jgi:hypothetical protein
VEEGDEFLALFPHRYDFIYADVPALGEKPNWKTESRYPLSDRAIQQAEQLFGVRFAKQTAYCLLDIDITSVYHPSRDRFAIANIVAALEPLGLVSYLACTSSYSGGIHLYFPFAVAQSSWQLAAAVTALLSRAGFQLRPGQLEVFPNAKPYVAGQLPSLFNAHRLPLQTGSYLLNADFQPIWSDRSTFVHYWRFAKQRNQIDASVLKRLLQTSRKPYAISGKAEKFLNDLNTEIEAGWTGHGQTNRLLGRIAMRAYVFHHLLAGGEPLTGPALVENIVATARSLPGYAEWCRHQSEIEQRSAEWAHCVEASRYFPYGSRKRSPEAAAETTASIEPKLTWNQQQTESARSKIRHAIACLLETNTLPAGTTQRFQALTSFGISGSSLYRHRDLWHPSCCETVLEQSVETVETVENPPHPPTITIHSAACADGAPADQNLTSLFPPTGCNAALSHASGSIAENVATLGCNAQKERSVTVVHHFNASIATLNHAQRMQQFLDSGDPILVAEARSQMKQQDHAFDRARDRFGDHAKDQSVNQLVNQLPVLRSSDLPKELRLPRSPAAQSQPHPLQEFTAELDRSNARILGRETGHCQASSAPVDVSDTLATIAVHIRRKKWTRSQTCDRLKQRFDKHHQAFLTEAELMEWLNWLQASEDQIGMAKKLN